jgi:hypothetical protein
MSKSVQGQQQESQPSTSTDDAKYSVAAMHSDSLLPNSCKLYPNTITVVESALRFDPAASRRAVDIICDGTDDDDDQMQSSKGQKIDRFCYPINIALTEYV